MKKGRITHQSEICFFFLCEGCSTKESWKLKDYVVVYPQKVHALHKRDAGEAQKPDQKVRKSFALHQLIY